MTKNESMPKTLEKIHKTFFKAMDDRKDIVHQIEDLEQSAIEKFHSEIEQNVQRFKSYLTDWECKKLDDYLEKYNKLTELIEKSSKEFDEYRKTDEYKQWDKKRNSS